MKRLPSWFFKKNPFVRLFIALATGILLHWYAQLSLQCWITTFISAAIVVLLFFQLPLFKRYRHSQLNGLFVVILFVSLGGLMTWFKDIRNKKDWIGKINYADAIYVAKLGEPLVEKNGSFKAKASVEFCISDDSLIRVSGNIFVYFTKYDLDSSGRSQLKRMRVGSRIFFRKTLQAINNSGNPGGFNYKRYCLFKQVTHQIFLKQQDWCFLTDDNSRSVNKTIYQVQGKIVEHLRSSIPGTTEAGLAEALLIGFKDDLDPALVQSYSNTGVVHIIAISGLHLGLIYAILVVLLKPAQKKLRVKWIRVALILFILWGFSMLAGAQPSVLRSALMFSFIVIAESLERRTSIINSLAASAFLLLCINPYWLWDLGFQLSYSAVLSIIIFMRPIYNLFFIRNRLLDLAWKLNAVTLAAQILTTPICIYNFHQFPVYFIISNFIAVPLSSFILIAELVLCLVAFSPMLSSLAGQFISACISLMNQFIRSIEQLPGSCWEGLHVSFLQVILMYMGIATMYTWLKEKRKHLLFIASSCMLLFLSMRSFYFLHASQQKKIIVYSISQRKAIDLLIGRKYLFTGDSLLRNSGFERSFHLDPSRTLHRVTELTYLPGTFESNCFRLTGKKILVITEDQFVSTLTYPLHIDIGIISGKKNISMERLVQKLMFKELVIDASVPDWKTKKLQRSCDSLSIPYFIVKEKGAFVRNLR